MPVAEDVSRAGTQRRNMLLAIAALFVAAVVVGGISLFSGDDEPAQVIRPADGPAEELPAPAEVDPVPDAASEPTATPEPAPTASPEPTPTPAPTPTPTPTPEPTPDATPTPEPEPTPTPAPGPTPNPDRVTLGTLDEVPESRAVVRSGQIFLEGAVPSEEAAQRIVALAAEVLGPDNVIDNYVLSDRAGDPNLGNIRVDDTVLFAYNSAEIAPEFEPLLDQARLLLTIRPQVTMTIEGHTDSIGSAERNLELSQERADAVAAYIAAGGIDPDRLTAVGKGETEPIADNINEAGRELNRRIQVFIENLLAE